MPETTIETPLDLYYPDSHRGFLADTEDHVMQIVHDDGIYRHIRFHAPSTSMYWFELVTWPGALTVRGDMGTFTFSRIEDMFEFFSEGYINPGYWAEKMPHESREGAYRHNEDSVRRQVTADWEERKKDFSADQQEWIWADLDMEVLGCTASDSNATYQALANFSTEGFGFVDVWEWDFKAWTTQFLWCCHAIRSGIQQYRTAIR